MATALYCSVSRYHSYLNTATEVIAHYKGEEPLSAALKKIFSSAKKYGGNDRKQITRLCYSYFRLGKAFRDLSIPERILTGLFLCSDSPNDVLENLQPLWNAKVALTLQDKCLLLTGTNAPPVIFPWNDKLSKGIDKVAFNASFLHQPDLFIRIRPGYDEIVTGKLRNREIEFKRISQQCLALPNSTKLEGILEQDREVVVQDLNSQRTIELLNHIGPPLRSWDCCAGSGGKSILLKDTFPETTLTVSDNRESILENLRKRFTNAGIGKFSLMRADLARPEKMPSLGPFQLIIADVPCTGSGTWSRNPEQLYFFREEAILAYAKRQQEIITNVVRYLAPGGHLLYITCSVFQKENEEIAGLTEPLGLTMTEMKMFTGYNENADTLFAALLKKQL